MSRQKSVLVLAVVAAVGVGAAAAGHDDRWRAPRRFKASLSGYSEVPSVSTPAKGSFRAVVSGDETEIEFWLDYRDLVPTVAHIHFGDRHSASGVAVWLCGGGGKDPCPLPGDDAEVSGTIVAADVIGPTTQGIGPGELGELLRAMRAGVTYVNVHSSTFPGGEIRGQLQAH